ncbi:glycosyltransferase [Flavobacterium sp.]|uniref:glycosyltransferase n=1 Tax=Flavobacterium sp. TaxID=239 RepID=UPI00404716D9
MKILFIAGTLGKGGAEKQLFYICRLLKQENHEIKVLSFTSGEYYEDEIKNLGIEVELIKPSKNKIIKLFEIYKYVKKIKPDVLYGFHFYTGIYVGIIGRITSVLSIGSIRSDGNAEKKANKLFSWLHYAFPNLMIANSKNAINNVKRIFYEKDVEYLPNIINVNWFEFKPKKDFDELRLLFIGSLKSVKRPELFVELVSILTNEGRKVKAKIIGEGNLQNELKNQAKNLPIEFFGNVNDVRPFLYETNYLISTSKLEGTPNVILEAFSTGTPVLALYHNGLKVWIKNNYLSDIRSIKEMKEQLLVNDEINLKKNRLFLEEEHSEEKFILCFKNILSKRIKEDNRRLFL